MRKDLGVKPAIFPMPVLMISTYDNYNRVDVMNAAWGMMVDMNKIALNLTESHKTVQNIKEKGAFVVSIADFSHMVESDYFGIVSANNTPDKFEKSGLHAVKSQVVDAPIIEEFPVAMECKFIEYQDDENGCGVIGEIVNVSVRDDVLDESGNIDVLRINAILYDPFHHGYYRVGEKVGNAFQEGRKLK